MRVVLASLNAGKLKELQTMLATTDLIIESQAQHDVPSADETGVTFVENALIKARAVSTATGLAAISDDSGLVVPALQGAPGIHSARYAGTHGDDHANNLKLVQALEDISDRRAYFFCAMVFMRHALDPTPLIATAAWHGEIIDEPRGSNGFGYDPHFYLPDLDKVSAQLEPGEKNQLSHRGQATAALLAQIKHAL